MKVQSSTIQDVSYSQSEKVLTVVFVSGATYRYPGVSRRERDALVRADSIGRHFARTFKPAHPTFEKVEA